MMSSQDESSLIERVFLRIGSAESDEQLQTALGKFLTPVILKLNSSEEAVRKKVMELLVHINKRLKSRPKVQLPVESLITQYQDPTATSIITNFSIIYIRMGFPRLEPQKQAELIPLLMNCLEGKPQSQQDSLMLLIIPALQHVTMPSDVAKRKELFRLSDRPQTVKVLLDYMMDVLVLPYSAQALVNQGARPASAPAGGGTPIQTPPCLSDYSFKRVTTEGSTPEALEKSKIGVLKFLGSDIFPEKDIVCHYVIAAADTRHSVATSADSELRRITGSVDWNDVGIINRLFTLFQGTVDIKGQPSTKPELRRRPACTRIRLKLFPFFLKSREATNVFPSCIQVIFDCLYGQNTNPKLKHMAVQFVHHLCLNCSDAKFGPISPVLLSGMVKLIGEAKEDAKLRSLAYVAVGKIVHKAPHLVKNDVALVQKFFDAICQEETETRLAVQESMSLMSVGFKQLDSTNQKLMEALIMQNIDKDQLQARMMAVQYAKTVFPSDHIPSRYVLLLASGDSKEDIAIEATKGLKITKEENDKSPDNVIPMPAFKEMVLYIKQKADQRLSSQQRFITGNYTLPFNPATFEKIMLYLRTCLASGAGIVPDMESLSSMQEQAPLISRYVEKLLQEDSSNNSPVQVYLDFVKQLLVAVGGSVAMYCMVEMVAMATSRFLSQFMSQLDWIKGYIFSSKDDLKDYASQLFALILCNQKDKSQIVDSVEEFMKKLNEKNFEVRQGSVIALGYLIAKYLKGRSCDMQTDDQSSNQEEQKLMSLMSDATNKIAVILNTSGESNATMVASACIALGDIGRNSALLLPPGGKGDGKEEITVHSVVNTLLKMVRSANEPNKTKDKAALCLGYFCVGDEDFQYRHKIMEEMMDGVQAKQIELHFTTGEALVFAAQGVTSPAARNMWTETEEDFKKRVSSGKDDVEWYLKLLLSKYVVSPNPHARQAACIWLLALVKKCSSHDALQSKLREIQGSFMKLLSENDDMTQDIASKGLGLVYEICTSEQKESLVSELVDTLMTGKRSKQEVTDDTKMFDEGSLGKTPDGSGLSTYKELCSIANDLNQPDLIYKFMHLASHNAMWNSKKGAAFGFSTIAAQAGEQLAPYLPQIVPKLYRYQFDPNPKIQQAMSSIWNALVSDNKNTVDTYLKEILYDLNKNLTSTQWRIRESSCLAVNDLLRGRQLDDVVEQLPELWENCLRVRDDIKESVRNAADTACRTLSRASIKICDINYGKMGEKAIKLVLPCLLKHSIQSPVSEVRAIGLSTMLKISKNAGPLLKPHIPVLVTALLEAVSGLEPQVLNYFSLRMASSQETQDKLDSARIAASKMSPMMETVNLCVQYVDESVLTELVPRITDLIKSGIGIGTKAGCSSFVTSLVHHCPKDLTPHAGKLMSAFLSGLSDRNASVRKSYASALGQLVKVAKDSSVEKLIIRLKSWYLEKEEESARNACGITLHAMSQQSPDVLKRHATLAMPLAFFAMHEKKSDEKKPTSPEDSLTIWDEVWLEVTPGTEAGIRLYLPEIVDLLKDSIDSQSWNTKAQAAAAMSTVASKLKDNLGPPHLGSLLSALLSGLQGRTWTGKESLLEAIDTVCTHCRESLDKDTVTDGQPSIQQIVEAVMKECKKEKLLYKLAAVRCMGSILELYSIDRFQDMWNIFLPLLSKSEDKKEDEDEIKPELKEEQLECYYCVLGQSWPSVKHTQESYGSEFCQMLCTSLPANTWKIQATILKSMYKFTDRLLLLKNKESLQQNLSTSKNYLTRISTAVIPCLGNIKYSLIRTEALSVIELILSKLTGLENLDVLSDNRSQLEEALSNMNNDSHPELKDKSALLLKSVQTLKI